MKDVAAFLKVLANETRLQMLWLLFHYEELCVCDLVEALGITQSKASRHLATLRHAGLVVDRKEGAWSYYSVAQIDGDLERSFVDTLRDRLAGRPDSARILQSLQTWTEQSERGASCTPAGAGARAPRRTSIMKGDRP